MALYIIPNLGKDKLQLISHDKVDYFLKYFRYSNEIPNPPITDLPSYWAEGETVLKFHKDTNTIDIICDLPPEKAVDNLQTVGIYSNDRILTCYLVIDFTIPKYTHQKVKITLNIQELYQELTLDNSVITPLSDILTEFSNAATTVDTIRDSDYPLLANKLLPSSLSIVDETGTIVTQYNSNTLTVDNTHLLEGHTKEEIKNNVEIVLENPQIQIDSNNFITKYPEGTNLSINNARLFDNHTYQDAIDEVQNLTPPRIELLNNEILVKYETLEDIKVKSTRELQENKYEKFLVERLLKINTELENKLNTVYVENEVNHLLNVACNRKRTISTNTTCKLDFNIISASDSSFVESYNENTYTIYLYTLSGMFIIKTRHKAVSFQYNSYYKHVPHTEYAFAIVKDDTGNFSRLQKIQIDFVDSYTEFVPQIYFQTTSNIEIICNEITSGTVNITPVFSDVVDIVKVDNNKWICTSDKIVDLHFLHISVEYVDDQSNIREVFDKIIMIAPNEYKKLSAYSFFTENTSQYGITDSKTCIYTDSRSNVVFYSNNDFYFIKKSVPYLYRSHISSNQSLQNQLFTSVVYIDEYPYIVRTFDKSSILSNKHETLLSNLVFLKNLTPDTLLSIDENSKYFISRINNKEIHNFFIGQSVNEKSVHIVGNLAYATNNAGEFIKLDIEQNLLSHTAFDFTSIASISDEVVFGYDFDSNKLIVYITNSPAFEIENLKPISGTAGKHETLKYFVFENELDSQVYVLTIQNNTVNLFKIETSEDVSNIQKDFELTSSSIVISFFNSDSLETTVLEFSPHFLQTITSVTVPCNTHSIYINKLQISMTSSDREIDYTATKQFNKFDSVFTKLDHVIQPISKDIAVVRKSYIVNGLMALAFDMEFQGQNNVNMYATIGKYITIHNNE